MCAPCCRVKRTRSQRKKPDTSAHSIRVFARVSSGLTAAICSLTLTRRCIRPQLFVGVNARLGIVDGNFQPADCREGASYMCRGLAAENRSMEFLS